MSHYFVLILAHFVLGFFPRPVAGGERPARSADITDGCTAYARAQAEPDMRGIVTGRHHGFLGQQGQLDNTVGR